MNAEKLLEHQGAILLAQSDGCAVWQFRNEPGDGTMTPMKTCFRSVYGAAIGTWLKNYRMNLAAELLLREKGLSVAEVGGRVGYDSAGKFTGAFKKVMHLTPPEYRRERGTRYEG